MHLHRKDDSEMNGVGQGSLPRQFYDPVKTSTFMSSYPQILPEEVFVEYTDFLRNLNPNLINSEKSDLVKKVKNELGIDCIQANMIKLDFTNIMHNGRGYRLLDRLGIFWGKSLNFLCPPVTECILCSKKLTKNNASSQVVIHSTDGPRMYSKYIYR